MVHNSYISILLYRSHVCFDIFWHSFIRIFWQFQTVCSLWHEHYHSNNGKESGLKVFSRLIVVNTVIISLEWPLKNMTLQKNKTRNNHECINRTSEQSCDRTSQYAIAYIIIIMNPTFIHNTNFHYSHAQFVFHFTKTHLSV